MTHWGEISCHAEKASESSLLLEPSERIRRLVTRVGIDFDRSAAAYHEAGHAVVGFWYGWVIEPRGVEIDFPTNDAVFACSAFAYTIEARAVVAMAGWLAELKWHRQGSTSHDAELIQILDGHDWVKYRLKPTTSSRSSEHLSETPIPRRSNLRTFSRSLRI